MRDRACCVCGLMPAHFKDCKHKSCDKVVEHRQVKTLSLKEWDDLADASVQVLKLVAVAEGSTEFLQYRLDQIAKVLEEWRKHTVLPRDLEAWLEDYRNGQAYDDGA